MHQWGCDAQKVRDEDVEDENDPDAYDWINPAEQPFKLGDEQWWGCPRRPVKDNPGFFAEVIRFRNLRETGFLPYPGSYMQQPNLMIEALAVVDAAMGEANKIRKAGRAAQQGG